MNNNKKIVLYCFAESNIKFRSACAVFNIHHVTMLQSTTTPILEWYYGHSSKHWCWLPCPWARSTISSASLKFGESSSRPWSHHLICHHSPSLFLYIICLFILSHSLLGFCLFGDGGSVSLCCCFELGGFSSIVLLFWVGILLWGWGVTTKTFFVYGKREGVQFCSWFFVSCCSVGTYIYKFFYGWILMIFVQHIYSEYLYEQVSSILCSIVY